jgi:hypothetical protein
VSGVKDPWAHVADPAPAIIDYIKQRNFKRLDAIVTNWESTGKLSNLLADLGLSKQRRKGRPRTQRRVNEETDIAFAVVNAARSGNGDPFAAAAAELKVTRKKARDAWDNWSQLRLRSMRIMAKHYDARGYRDAAKANRTAIKILEKHEK